MNSLLGHLLVLDLADETASYCSMLLSGLGANVIKVEKPGGDPSRNIGPFHKTGEGKISLPFLFNNAGKKSITLNLEMRPGRDVFRRLSGCADIIVETLPAGYLKRKRLDYDRLKVLNQRLIMASVRPFGQTGPHSSFAADDAVISAAAGLTYLHGDRQQSPVNPQANQSFCLASLFALSGILLALQYRNITGRGQFIDISMQEAAASTLVNPFARFFSEGIITHRNGRMSRDNMAGIFPCSDGYIFLTFDREWDIIIDLMASDNFDPGLGHGEWSNPAYRRQHGRQIADAVTAWTRTYKVAQLFELGQSMRFPWAPVMNMASLKENPQLKSRGSFFRAGQAGTALDLSLPGMPYIFDGNRGMPVLIAPLTGEHNDEVYGKMLSLPEKEIASLKNKNAI